MVLQWLSPFLQTPRRSAAGWGYKDITLSLQPVRHDFVVALNADSTAPGLFTLLPCEHHRGSQLAPLVVGSVSVGGLRLFVRGTSVRRGVYRGRIPPARYCGKNPLSAMPRTEARPSRICLSFIRMRL
jgi:hypothetical protein